LNNPNLDTIFQAYAKAVLPSNVVTVFVPTSQSPAGIAIKTNRSFSRVN
jgi:hypothetical protein